jgi:hypothetical protein
VLIDAGSTLTQDDLATVQTLCDAGIPASVLLSKADLLAPADRDRALQYVGEHIHSDLGFELPVLAISIKSECSDLLEKWLANEILPLYDRHAELARQSLNRKIGALRLGVEAALKAHLKRSGCGLAGSKVRDLETQLRTAAGRIAQARTECVDRTDALRECADAFMRTASENLVDAWNLGASATGEDLIKNKLEKAAVERAAQIVSAIQEAAREAGRVLATVATALEIENNPDQDELLDVLKNMPRFDLGNLELTVGPSAVASLLGRRWAVARVERRIRTQAVDRITDAVGIYARVLQAWVRKTFTELQERFESYAGGYRAHLERMAASKDGVADEQALQDDLAALDAPAPKA